MGEEKLLQERKIESWLEYINYITESADFRTNFVYFARTLICQVGDDKVMEGAHRDPRIVSAISELRELAARKELEAIISIYEKNIPDLEVVGDLKWRISKAETTKDSFSDLKARVENLRVPSLKICFEEEIEILERHFLERGCVGDGTVKADLMLARSIFNNLLQEKVDFDDLKNRFEKLEEEIIKH